MTYNRALAQTDALRATLSINPYPSPYISDWETSSSFGEASLTNTTDTNLTLRVSVRVVRERSGVIATAQSQLISVPPGDFARFSTGELTGYESYSYANSIENQIIQTGRLPEGEYEFCLDFEDEFGGALLSNVCASFFIVDPTPPSLLFPFDEEIVEGQFPSFQWTPVQAPASFPVKYDVKIVEILDGQVPAQALAANIAHYHSSSVIESNLLYPIDAIELEAGHKYVWQVRALGESDQPASSNNGYSEIWTFIYSSSDIETPQSTDARSIEIAPAGGSVSGLSLPSLDNSTFEEVRDKWNSFKSGEAVTIPIPGMGDFERFNVPNVQVAINDTLKMISFRGRTERFNEPAADVLLTLRWKGLKSAATICIKLPTFSFGGAFVEFASLGRFEELALDFSLIGFSNRNEKLSAAFFPGEFADFFEDQEVELKPGMNFHGVISIDRTPWFQRFVSFAGVEDNQVILKGYGGPVRNLLTKKTAKDFELSLSAQLPAIVSPDFRLWLKSRQFELEGGIRRALDSIKSSDTLAKNDATEAQYTPYLKLTETLKGSFFDNRELTFFRSLELSQTIGDTVTKVGVRFGSKDTLHLGLDWLNIHDVTLALEGEAEKTSVTLNGAISIGSVKLADSVLIGIETQSTKADTSKGVENESSFKEKSVGASKTKGKTKYRLKAALSDDFTLGDIWKIVKVIHPDPFLDGGGERDLSGLFDLSDFSFGINNSLELEVFFAGKTTLRNSETDLMVSLTKDFYGKRSFTLGIKPISWRLTEAIPALSNPVLDNLDFSNVGFVVTNKEARFESSDLGPDTHEFYSKIYASDEYTLVLKPGINMIAVIPFDNLQPDDPLITLMDHLGMHSKGLMLQGSFGNVFGLLSGEAGGSSSLIKDIYLKAGLPPMQPPGAPKWFVSGELALEVTGAPSVGMLGAITVDINGDILTFFVQGKIARDGAGVAVAIVGGLEAEKPWKAPFGIGFLTLNKTVVKVSVNAYGNIGLGFAGDLVIGEKDIKTAVAVAINAYTGVPTNAIFDGESDEGLELYDIATLQNKMVAAASGGEPPMLPIDALPNIAIKKMGLKFAPKSDPDLGVEAGMAIKGDLWVGMTPGGEMSNIAGVDCAVGVEGIWMKGHLASFKVGPLTWEDALLDIQMIPGESHFVIVGEVDMLGSMKMVDISLSRDSLKFETETKIDGLYTTSFRANGAFNLTNPSFEVNGELQSDFGDVLATPLSEGLKIFAVAGAKVVDAALEAYEHADLVQAKKQSAVDELERRLKSVRAGARQATLTSKKTKDAAYVKLKKAIRAKNSTYRSYRGIPKRKVKAKLAALNRYRTALAGYRRQVVAHVGANAKYVSKLTIYKSIPDPDNNPALLGLKGQADKLWNELLAQKEKLKKLQAIYREINDFLAAASGPLVVMQKTSFNSSLNNLVKGQGVDVHLEMLVLERLQEMDVKISFDNIGEAVKTILQKLIKG